MWHEEVGAVLRAKLQSQGGHYSDRTANARYDWLTLNHFADMSGEDGVGVTLSNGDCYFMRLGDSTVSQFDITTPQISVLTGGRVAHGDNGLPNQGGDTSFVQRFALQTRGAYDPASAMRFALEHQNPFLTALVTGGQAYPSNSYSFLGLSETNVLLWALKPAEEGISQGLIARVWNLSTNAAQFALKLAQPLAGARRASHIETDLENLAITNGALAGLLAGQKLQTFRLLMAKDNSSSQPKLRAEAIENGVLISWPGWLTNFFLEVTSRLDPPTRWLPDTNVPAAAGGQIQVVVDHRDWSRLYRLQPSPAR